MEDSKPIREPTPDEMLDRQHHISENIEGIYQSYRDAFQAGDVSPIVVVCDVRDNWGSAFAETNLGWHEAESLTEVANRQRKVPILILSMAHDDAAKSLQHVSPNAKTILSRTIPNTHFWVVCVASNGLQYQVIEKPVTGGKMTWPQKSHEKN